MGAVLIDSVVSDGLIHHSINTPSLVKLVESLGLKLPIFTILRVLDIKNGGDALLLHCLNIH